MSERKIERPVKWEQEDQLIYLREPCEWSGLPSWRNRVSAWFQGGPVTPKEELVEAAKRAELALNNFDALVAALREAQEEIHEALVRGQITPSAARIVAIQERDSLLQSLQQPRSNEEEPKP